MISLAIPIASLAPAAPTPSATSPPNPSAPTSIHAQKAEEVARTVYVGNLNPKVTNYFYYYSKEEKERTLGMYGRGVSKGCRSIEKTNI